MLRYRHAGVAELADAQDLGSCAARCAGSTPVTRILLSSIFFNIFLQKVLTKSGRGDIITRLSREAAIAH